MQANGKTIPGILVGLCSGFLLLISGVASSPGASASSNADSFVIDTESVGGMGVGDVSLEGALRFLARTSLPSKVLFRAGSCELIVRERQLRMAFFRLDNADAIGTPNTCTMLIALSASDPRWHTVRGLRVGSTIAEVQRLYPKATRFGVVPPTAIGLPRGARVWTLASGTSSGVSENLVGFVIAGKVVGLGLDRVGH